MKDQEAPRKHTIPNHAAATPTINCFVYGTLKRGFPNHDRFCRNAIDIQPATVLGRLYNLGAYPALEVPEESILAHGTTDPLADAATQAHYDAHMPPHASNTPPPGDWDPIHGELITFSDPARDLPPLDQLEGYNPGIRSFYQRVLVRVHASRGLSSPAWLYVAARCLASESVPLRIASWA